MKNESVNLFFDMLLQDDIEKKIIELLSQNVELDNLELDKILKILLDMGEKSND